MCSNDNFLVISSEPIFRAVNCRWIAEKFILNSDCMIILPIE